MVVSRSPAPSGPELGGRRDRGFRPDIQGLRAIAVGLVLAYHLWPSAMPGGFVGVDAFFVISGFLITEHLLARPPRHARDLLEFWGRRIRRILPAAFLVLIVTAIASRLLAPDTEWAATATQIIASGLYVQNWVLAGNAVDYLAAAAPPTPVQHYWSLAVEEQFYLGWPVLILAVFWVARRARIGSLGIVRLGMLAVVGISLVVSITATATDAASAYFITPTRVWELAVGGLAATHPRLEFRRVSFPWSTVAAWLGLAMLIASGLAFSADTPFPGAAALVPVGGTAIVILAEAGGLLSPTRLLRARPIQHIGDTSYSIYLWHWPIIVLLPYLLGRSLTLLDGVAVVILTIGLATLTKAFVEDPFRFAPSFQPLKPTFRFAAAGMVVVSMLGGAQLVEAQLRVNAAVASEDAATAQGPDQATLPLTASLPPGSTAPPAAVSCFGAASIVHGFTLCPQNPAAHLVPDPLVAAGDRSDAYRDGCWNYAPFATRTTCQFGSGPIRIALVGNSHAGEWLPALEVLAKQHGWTITTYLASVCNATDAPLEFYSTTKTAGCLAYGQWALSQTRGRAFDLVITSERQSIGMEGNPAAGTMATAEAGYSAYLTSWSTAGTHVLVLHDTPYPGQTVDSIPDCLAQHLTNQGACSGTPSTWSWIDPLYAAATSVARAGVTTLDTRPFLCTSSVCPAVIGSVVAYFDASHMTATYARTIAPFLYPTIEAALVHAGLPSASP